MKRFVAVALAFTLSACLTAEQHPREIDVSTGVVEPSSAMVQNIDTLIARTSPSYVTMVVHDGATEEIARAQNLLADAVTSGSGFIIDDDGHVLTAGHVAIERGWRVEARGPSGETLRGQVQKVFESNDLALVRLERASHLTPVVPAANHCLAVGEQVFSLGKPREQGDTARLGVVESMSFGRAVSYDSFGYPDAVVLQLQTRKGESGGPVFNSRGELIAMLVSTLSDANGRNLDLAHAISTPVLARFICDEIDCSTRWRALTGSDPRDCPAAQAANIN